MPKRGREKYIHCHRNIRNSCLEISCQNDHLSPNRYNCRHLTSTAIALTTNINTPLATPLQREALAYFKSKLTTTFSLSSNPTEIPDIKVIERYFELFDALLFFGSLRGRVELVNADQQAQHAGCPGHTQPIPALEKTFTFSFRKPKPQSSPNLLQRITLFRRDVDARDRQQRLTLSLSALLHEMIHAFFNTWACQSGKCRARKFEKMGEGGHGCLWVDLATACEQVVKEVLGLELNLRRLEAIVSEVVRGVKEGLDVQSLRRDFEEWGLDFAEFEQKVKEKGKTEGPKRSLGGKKLIGDDLAMMAGGLQDSFWNSSDGEGGGSGGSVPSDEEPTIIEAVGQPDPLSLGIFNVRASRARSPLISKSSLSIITNNQVRPTAPYPRSSTSTSGLRVSMPQTLNSTSTSGVSYTTSESSSSRTHISKVSSFLASSSTRFRR